MAELGYQEGRNFTFDYIQTPDVEGYERNYRELAARKVDVFLAVGNERALRAALLAAEGRPIAFLAVDFDPLARGYVASLSRPGGNVTGIFVRQLELAAKRVEIAREAFPRATVIGIAFDTVSHEQRDAASEAARKLGLEPRMIEVKGQQDYGGAFNAMDDARGQPIILPAGPMFFRDREAIAQALLERRIPSIAAFRENMEAGALISYGFDLMGLFYDIAAYVHQIARGAKLSDMPIEQSPRFYMAVNLKTAASLGVSLSDVFVARANEGTRMRRREFITLLGAAAAWPLAARAQQPSMPVVGWLGSGSAEPLLIAALHRGLREAGFIDRRNVAFEYRWANGEYERLPAQVAELVERRVAVIVAGAPPAAHAAKAATSTIPVVFSLGTDPVKTGLVESLNRPGGNLTGITQFSTELEAKRLEILRESVPNANLIALLVNPNFPASK